MNNTEKIMQRDALVIANTLKLRFFPISIASAKGSTLYDDDNHSYLDFNSGWGVANIGYGNQRVIDAINKQLHTLTFNCLLSTSNEQSVTLAEKLISLIPGNFNKKVWFGHSGSDANEFVSKIVPYFTKRPRIITFIGSYHGQTMGSYAMSGHPSQGEFIGGGNIIKVPYPYCYRCPFGKEKESCELFCASYIENYILGMSFAPEQVGAMVFESIISDGGDVVPPKEFFKKMEFICKKHGILMISDEVKIGLGRTGKMFGFQHWNIIPDVVILGKPLAGGLPLSAVVGPTELMDAGYAMHMFTTAGDPTSCAAAIETIKVIEEDELVENAQYVGTFLLNEFTKLKKKYKCIGDVRGKGLIIGIEFVKDLVTKEPDAHIAELVVFSSYQRGLLYYNAGIKGNVIEFTPPLVLTMEEAKQAVTIIEQSIYDATTGKIPETEFKGFTGWN